MAMQRIAELIKCPEKLSKETIPVLSRLLERYPYYQTARLLLLQNLYKEKDPLFTKELSRSAVLLADRSVLFEMINGEDYKIESVPVSPTSPNEIPEGTADRTQSLIELFLGTDSQQPASTHKVSSVTNPIDASVDYMGYLMQQEGLDGVDEGERKYIGKSRKIVLEEKEKYETPDETEPAEEDFFTETLAKIYIKQKKYARALEIIRALSTANPKKNSYFADQIRFLEKIIEINKNNEEHV